MYEFPIPQERRKNIRMRTDGQGNYLRYWGNAILCQDCDEPLILTGYEDGFAGGFYTWACPQHGEMRPPTNCPSCGSLRQWKYPNNKGAVPYCRVCEGRINK